MLALSAEELFSLTPREGSAAVGQQDEQVGLLKYLIN